MARGGARPGAGRKPDPESKTAKARAAKAERAAAKAEAEAPKAIGHSQDGRKAATAPPDWPFGTQDPPPALPNEIADEVVDPNLTPLEFALQTMRDPLMPMPARLAAMAQALPYCHAKKGEEGKKAQKQAAAEAVQSKFTRSAPPRLVSSRD